MYYDKLTQQRFLKIEELVTKAIQAPNKASAKRFIDELKIASCCLPPPSCNIASELLAATSDATGKVVGKESYVKYANSKLYSLRTFVEKD